MTENPWTLDEESQDRYLLPWLDKQPESQRAVRVIDFLAGLTLNPDRPHLENGEGVFSAEVAGFGLVWLLDVSKRNVVLVAEPRDLSPWD